MYQGTTPILALSIPGYDLTECTVYVTLDGSKRQFTLPRERLQMTYEDDATTIIYAFTQKETFDLPTGTMKVQVRWIDAEGQAMCTEESNVNVNSVLLNKVINYEAPAEAEEAEEEE